MTGGVNTQHDTRIRAGAMGWARQPSNRPIGHADRRLDSRGAAFRRLRTQRGLDSWGGDDIFAPTGPGGVAGQSPNGKCRVMDIAGTIHAVFRAQGGAMMYMQYAKDAWSEPVKIDGPAHIHSLSLGMDSKGGLYAFLARPGGVRVSRRIEGSWQPTKMIAKDAFSPYFWTATSVGAPAVAVVWCEGEGPRKEPFEIRLAVLNP